MRSRSGQPCSLCRAVDLRVLRPARRIHIRRRGRVLHNSPPPASVRSAGGPDRDRAWHLWSSSSRDVVPRPRAPLATAFGGSLRSGDTPLPAPSLPASSRRYAPPCFVGGIPPSRLATCTTAHPPNRAVSCRSARHSARRPASSLHVKPLQAIPTTTNRVTTGKQLRGKSDAQTCILQRFRGVRPQIIPFILLLVPVLHGHINN